MSGRILIVPRGGFPIHRTVVTTPLHDEIERLFSSFFNTVGHTIRSQGNKQLPRVNAYFKDNKLCLDAYVPMATKENISINIDEKTRSMTIIINETTNKDIANDDYLIKEITGAQMTRTFSIDDNINIDTIKSTLKDGILHIEADSVIPEEPVKETTRKISIE